MAVYAPRVKYEGSSSKPISVSGGAHIFSRSYYRSRVASGDVRAHYEDLEHTSTGSGETFRIRGIVSGAGGATGGTINAIHATGRVATGGTVSGALNAIRATIESAVAAPGGTIAALQLDSNLAANSTHGLNSSAFIRVTQSGSTDLGTLMILPAAEADNHSATVLCTAGVDKAATHYIRIVAGSTPMWILATTTAPAHS